MFVQTIDIQAGQTLTLEEMASNVVASSWDGAAIEVELEQGSELDLAVEVSEAGPALSARQSCQIRVPVGVPLRVRQVMGNLKVKEITSLNAEQVRGNLKLREVDEAQVAEVYGNVKAGEVASLRVTGTVYGDALLSEVRSADMQNVRGNLVATESQTLRVSRISGNLVAKEVAALDAGQVGGNAVLKEIAGTAALDQVAGNLTAKNLAGGLRAGLVGGNLLLYGGLGSGCTYQALVSGNALLRFEGDAGAHLSLTARGLLLSSLALAGEERNGQTLTGTLGNGGAEVTVEARGNLLLGGGEGGAGNVELNERIAAQVRDSLKAVDLEGVTRHVGEEVEAAMARLRFKMEGMDWDRMGSRAQAAVERAMERMQQHKERWTERAAREQERIVREQERMTREHERLAHHAERAARHAEHGHLARGGVATAGAAVDMDDEAGAPDVPAAEEPRPGLDEERLAILKMVEQGQVTPKDAELLLDALG